MQGDRPGEPERVKYPVIYIVQAQFNIPFTQHCVALENCIALLGEMNWSSDVFLLLCFLCKIYSLVSNYYTLQLIYERKSPVCCCVQLTDVSDNTLH